MGIWIRVSPAGENDRESPEHHEARARKYIEMKGWQAVELYDLSWVSGKSVMKHPECIRMLRDIETGRISGLIFSNLTRLARNTRELLDFCDIFNQYNADLISLSENIDTSSPAGKLLFTLMASLAQFERETIAARVAASVPIRAELGKPLGGQAPYGYQWKNKELSLDQKEAPVRKLMFELYLKEQRFRKVVEILNSRGYRTRKGGKWTGTTLERLLTDPIAKGLRRANYTRSEGKDKRWILKPKDEWVFQKVQAIVSEEIWNQVNTLIKSQKSQRTRRKTIHLFSGLTFCHCGSKMYLLSNTPKYTCNDCRNKIHKDDLETIFHEQLRDVLFNEDFAENLNEENLKSIQNKNTLLNQLKKDEKKLTAQLEQLLELQQLGEIPSKGFRNHYLPIYEQLEQIQNRIPQIELEIDSLANQSEMAVDAVQEAKDIHKEWKFLSETDKRAIIELIVEKITIFEKEVEIRMMGLPKKKSSPPSNSGNNSSPGSNTRNNQPQGSISNDLQNCHATSWIHRTNQHECGGVLYRKFGSRYRYPTLFERLTHDFQHSTLEFW